MTIAHWRAQLGAVPDEIAGPLLGRVGATGDMGIPILVEALASPRERIAHAARQTLLEQIDQWKTLSAAGSSPKFALLAHELADRQSELGPAGRHDAAELAVLILRGPLDPGTIDTVEVIACCEKVLRAAQADPAAAVTDALARRADNDAASAARLALQGPDRWPTSAGQEPSAHETATPALLPSPGGSPTAGSPPLPLANTDGAQQDAGSKSSAAGATSSSSSGENATVPFKLPGQNPADNAIHQASAAEKLSPEPPSSGLKSVDSFELLQQSCSPVEETSAAARAELSRRGFTEVHFDLARRLFSADPAVRKELARALPELRSIDAAPWLMQLGKDADAEVRLTAITLMATSGDPLLLEEVERIAGEDSDPRIRDQVDALPSSGATPASAAPRPTGVRRCVDAASLARRGRTCLGCALSM